MMLIRSALAFLLLSLAGVCTAQISSMSQDAGESYYYVDHYEILINQPVNEVWQATLAMGQWVPFLADALPEEPVVEGQVFHLYDQFSLKVAQLIPEQMLLLINLPTVQESEYTQGVVMISLAGTETGTLVSMFMSRAYFWFDGEQNPLRYTRESRDFQQERNDTYSRLLQNLKNNIETED